MKTSHIVRSAKALLITAVILTVSLLSVQLKAEIISPEERSISASYDNFFCNTNGKINNREDFPGSGFDLKNRNPNEVLLAAAKISTRTTRKKRSAKRASNTTDYDISLSVKAAYLMPMGDWKDLIDKGYGAMLDLCFNDLFVKGFQPGIETGFLYASGKPDSVNSEYIVPMFLTAGYMIDVAKNFGIVPRISIGEGYFNLSYKPAGSASAKTKSQFEFMAKGGLSITYDLSKTIAIRAESEYGMVFEKDGRLPFVLFQLGCSINF